MQSLKCCPHFLFFDIANIGILFVARKYAHEHFCALKHLFKTVEIPHYPIREFTQSATNIRLSHRYTGVTQHPADGIQVRTSQIQVGSARLPGRM